ncbi:hypothetical protein H2199_004914 [Coniosporium tulheliwenetii]|uniref:Uncharacterized protein n=1 Tax=Coniosporium tulheliwenetii TaxID=3383036 RepID=A0ACC2Z4D3_9PEZI|nr:hypothetical protein H2199_004914 [Cladosporium sp. JES 115]
MEQKDQIRVAIVGSGMAGLVTAYLLNRDVQSRYAVTLFEAASIAIFAVLIPGIGPTDTPQGDLLSLDSASLTVPNPSQGCSDRVDLPMRAFAGGFYNNLRAMYDYLGVEYHAQSFLFNFSKVAARDTGPMQKERRSSYFVHSSNNHRIPPVRPEGIRTAAWLMEILYLLVCYTWFTACCFFVVPRPGHYTVSNGVQDVQRKLAKGIDTRLSAMVLAVVPQPFAVRVCWRHTEDTNGLTVCEELFDRVILAVSPDVVEKVFRPLQYEMAQIPTVSVESIIHTDYNNLGERLGRLEGQNTAATNSHLNHTAAHTIQFRTSTESVHRTEAIHVQASGTLVTTCPFSYIDPVHVIRASKFTRVLRTPKSRRIVNSIFGNCYPIGGNDDEKQRPGWKHGDGRVWLVGGWCWDGLVLLEGCIVSAMRVAEAFDVQVPWRDPGFETAYNDR